MRSRKRKTKKPPQQQAIQAYLTREKVIDPRITVFVSEESDEPVDFEDMLQRILKNEKLGKNEHLCYIGSSIFAIFLEKNHPSGKPQFVEVRRIACPHAQADWQKELISCSMNDYDPNPEPLSLLYKEMQETTSYFDS